MKGREVMEGREVVVMGVMMGMEEERRVSEGESDDGVSVRGMCDASTTALEATTVLSNSA